jgi:uncharacterized membrane protein YphA (DoxX/SURF4 family)
MPSSTLLSGASTRFHQNMAVLGPPNIVHIDMQQHRSRVFMYPMKEVLRRDVSINIGLLLFRTTMALYLFQPIVVLARGFALSFGILFSGIQIGALVVFFLSGVLLMLGIRTREASLAVVVAMVTIDFFFQSSRFSILTIALFVALYLSGAGRYSLDSRSREAARAASANI